MLFPRVSPRSGACPTSGTHNWRYMAQHAMSWHPHPWPAHTCPGIVALAAELDAGLAGQGSDIHVMLALRRRSRQSVVTIDDMVIRVKRGVLPGGWRHLCPQRLGTRVAALAHVKGNDRAGRGLQGEPAPLFGGLLLHEAAHGLRFDLKASEIGERTLHGHYYH